MALVRVKRRAQDDPIDVLLLASKRIKTDEDDKPISNVFRFLATVDQKEDDNIKEHLDHAKKTIPKKKVTFRNHDLSTITEKLKAENKLFSQSNRLKVINCFRAIHPGEEDTSDVTSYTVVDIENAPIREESKDSDSSDLKSTAEQYVYDLYYTHSTNDFSDLQMEHSLSAHEVDEKLLFGQDVSEDEDICDDDDDSNDENNWRNDYPDEDVFRDEEEDEKSSIDEDDMREAVLRMKNVKINGDYSSDLSSDDNDEELIYGIEDHMKYYHKTVYNESDDEIF